MRLDRGVVERRHERRYRSWLGRKVDSGVRHLGVNSGTGDGSSSVVGLVIRQSFQREIKVKQRKEEGWVGIPYGWNGSILRLDPAVDFWSLLRDLIRIATQSSARDGQEIKRDGCRRGSM